MTIHTSQMDISVTEFKRRCLEIIREVERTGRAVAIKRRGKIVARLQSSSTLTSAPSLKPWERLRSSASCLFDAEESVLRDTDCEVAR